MHLVVHTKKRCAWRKGLLSLPFLQTWKLPLWSSCACWVVISERKSQISIVPMSQKCKGRQISDTLTIQQMLRLKHADNLSPMSAMTGRWVRGLQQYYKRFHPLTILYWFSGWTANDSHTAIIYPVSKRAFPSFFSSIATWFLLFPTRTQRNPSTFYIQSLICGGYSHTVSLYSIFVMQVVIISESKTVHLRGACMQGIAFTL